MVVNKVAFRFINIYVPHYSHCTDYTKPQNPKYDHQIKEKKRFIYNNQGSIKNVKLSLTNKSLKYFRFYVNVERFV